MGGLRLSLYIGKNENYRYRFLLNPKKAAVIFIYDHDRFYTEADRIEISGGSSGIISMNKKITQMAVKPYSECVIKDNKIVAVNASTDTELVDLFIKSKYKYNYANCYDVCYQDLLNQTCGCIDETTPFLNLKNIINATLCHHKRNCYENNFKKKIFEYCHKKCPYECDIVSISKTLLSQSSRYDEKYVAISIYYPELSYESTTESPTITEIALAGTIGGTLGKQK